MTMTATSSSGFRSAIPSNSLAVLYGLARECAQQRVIGDDVEIEIHAFDETNTHIRPGKPREAVWSFYPRYFFATLWKQSQWITLFLRLHLLYRKIKADPRRHEYTDLALTPVVEDEDESRELFSSKAAKAYLDQQKRFEKMRRGEPTLAGQTKEVSTVTR